jgi:hypothetical protein
MEDNTGIGGRPDADPSDSSALHGKEVVKAGRGVTTDEFLTSAPCPYMSIIFAGSVKNQWHKFLRHIFEKVVKQ